MPTPSFTPVDAFRWSSPLLAFFDNDTVAARVAARGGWSRLGNLVRLLPFIGMHIACISVVWVGVSWIAAAVAVALYVVRMFAITGFYHRYFSHRSYRTSRPLQLLFAVLGGMAVQRGALWWAAHHRHHHRHSDQEQDVHSPKMDGLWYSHVGWIGDPVNFATDYDRVRDLTKFPELHLLNRFDLIPPLILAAILYWGGEALAAWAPGLGTNGLQLIVWGFVLSTVACYHGTFTINSLSHIWGTRPYETGDTSRNNYLLALVTLGEGWHNNHHRFQASGRSGLHWWQLDITWMILWTMEKTGLIWDLKRPPAAAYASAP